MAERAIVELGGERHLTVTGLEPEAGTPRAWPDGEVSLPRYELGDKVATRLAFGQALAAVGARGTVVALDGEVGNSTHLEEFSKAVAAGDRERIADLGYSFHRQINLAADSHRLALLLGSVVNHLPNRFYASIEEQVSATGDEHPLLVAAMRRHDVRKARSLMEHHIMASADHLVDILEERGLWDDEGAEARESAS